VQKAALVETHSPAEAAAAANQNPPSKSLMSSFSQSFISSGKQGGAAVLWEGHDIVTRETCILTSLNVNNLGKATALHPAHFYSWGHTKLSLPIIRHSCAYVGPHTGPVAVFSPWALTKIAPKKAL
jgi:hypothetical protein